MLLRTVRFLAKVLPVTNPFYRKMRHIPFYFLISLLMPSIIRCIDTSLPFTSTKIFPFLFFNKQKAMRKNRMTFWLLSIY